MKPLLLTNARVFREDRSKAEQGDLFISESGYSLGKGLAVPEEGRVIDLSGLCVSPGWVDFHTHLFGSFGIFSVPPEKIGRGEA